MLFVGAMDTFARGLKIAAKVIEDGVMAKCVKERYSSYENGIGAKIVKGETSFEELEVYFRHTYIYQKTKNNTYTNTPKNHKNPVPKCYYKTYTYTPTTKSQLTV